MRRYDSHFPEDPPEIVVAERLEAIAYDLERIADALEDDPELATDGGADVDVGPDPDAVERRPTEPFFAVQSENGEITARSGWLDQAGDVHDVVNECTVGVQQAEAAAALVLEWYLDQLTRLAQQRQQAAEARARAEAAAAAPDEDAEPEEVDDE